MIDLLCLGGFYSFFFHKQMRKKSVLFQGAIYYYSCMDSLLPSKRFYSQILACIYLLPSLCLIPILVLDWTWGSKLNLINWQRNKHLLLKTEERFFPELVFCHVTDLTSFKSGWNQKKNRVSKHMTIVFQKQVFKLFLAIRRNLQSFWIYLTSAINM